MKSQTLAILSGISTALIVILAVASLVLYLDNRMLRTKLADIQDQEVLEGKNEVSNRNICINQLQIINGAKQQWALENNKRNDAEPEMVQLLPYMLDHPMRCPIGGRYTINPVNQKPTCSVPNHQIE